MPVHNAEIAAIFDQTAELLEVKGEDQISVRAYRSAARTLETLPISVATLLERGMDLTTVPGIGKDLALKIVAIVKTAHFDLLDSLKLQIPGDLSAVAAIPGLGPKRVQLLRDNLAIRTVDDLRRAAEEGRLRDIRGIGMAVEKRVLALLAKPQQDQRFALPLVQAQAEALMPQLADGLGDSRLTAVGSVRRRRDTVRGLDLLVTGANAAAVAERLSAHESVAEIRAHGPTRTTVGLASGLQVDLRIVAEDCFGAALLYFTGSKRHNIALRTLAGVRGWKLNEYGLFAGRRRIAGDTEEEIYARLGLQPVPPELREDRGEIALARDGRLPILVTTGDLRGDLHVRCPWTDDDAPVAAFAMAARERGYEYIALVDVAGRMARAHGLDADRVARRAGVVDRLAAACGVTVFKGIEADIRPDGTVDLPDAIASRVDFVIAGMHSHFDLPAAQQTERLARAVRDPRVKMLAHPSGRVLGVREGCALDFRQLLSAAQESGCVLEIDARPDRLDLDDAHSRAAHAAGVALTICSNAGDVAALPQMDFGVDQARRAWLAAGDVVNTRPLAEIRALLAR